MWRAQEIAIFFQKYRTHYMRLQIEYLYNQMALLIFQNYKNWQSVVNLKMIKKYKLRKFVVDNSIHISLERIRFHSASF